MKSEIKDISLTKKKIQIEITPEDLDFYCNQALKELSKDLELPGFRKGMVPESIANQKINDNSILSYAAELAITQKWNEYINQSDLEIISQPKIDIIKLAKGNPFVFSAEVDVLSDFKLPDLKSIAKNIKKEEIVVEDKDINDALQWIQQSRAILKDKEGGVENGDFVEITIIDKENKEKKDEFIVGKGHYIQGLEDLIISMTLGQEKEIDSNTRIRLDNVKKLELPEINDDFAKSLGKFDSLDLLKKNIEEGIKQEKEIALKQKKRAELLDVIASKIKIEIPQSLIERETQGLLSNLQNRVKRELNIGFDDYLAQTKKTQEQVNQEFTKIAEERVRNFLIIRQIIKDEKIEAEEDAINQRIQDVFNNHPDPEIAKKEIDLNKIKLYIEDEIKTEKAFNLLGF
jgi:trigger factor